MPHYLTAVDFVTASTAAQCLTLESAIRAALECGRQIGEPKPRSRKQKREADAAKGGKA